LDAKGKVIGIAAQNNTYHALASTQFIPMIGFNLHLPHRQVEMNGKKITTFSSGFNEKGGMVSDVISQVINGGVDAIKDDFLIDLVGSNELIPTALFLSRCGTDPEYVFTFLRQPIIQQFMKLYSKEKGITGISTEKTYFPGKKRLTESIKAELMKSCKQCEALIPARSVECKFCGYIYKPKTRTQNEMAELVLLPKPKLNSSVKCFDHRNVKR